MITNLISNINDISKPKSEIEFNKVIFILSNGLRLGFEFRYNKLHHYVYFETLLESCVLTEPLLEYVIDMYPELNWSKLLNKYPKLSLPFILKYIKNGKLNFVDLINTNNYINKNDYIIHSSGFKIYNLPIEYFIEYPKHVDTKLIALYLQKYGLEYSKKLNLLIGLNDNIFYYIAFINCEDNLDIELCYKYKKSFSLACYNNESLLLKYLCTYPNKPYDLSFIKYILNNLLQFLQKSNRTNILSQYIIAHSVYYENLYTLILFESYAQYIIINDFIINAIDTCITINDKKHKWDIPEELIDLYFIDFKPYLLSIIKYQKLSSSFLNKYFIYIDNKNDICKHQILTEDFMNIYHSSLNFDIIICSQSVSENFIKKHFTKFKLKYLIEFQILSESFIETNIELNKYNLKLIFTYQSVSDYFIDKYVTKSTMQYVVKFQHLSDKFILDRLEFIDCKCLLQNVKLLDTTLLTIINYYKSKYLSIIQHIKYNQKNTNKHYKNYKNLIKFITDPTNNINIPVSILQESFIPKQWLVKYLSHKIAYPKPEWFLIKHKDIINWNEATKHPLSESLIENLFYKEIEQPIFCTPYLSNIYKYSNLSIEFMDKFKSKLYFPDVILYQKPSSNLINSHLNYLNENCNIEDNNVIVKRLVYRILNWYKIRSYTKKINYLSMFTILPKDNKLLILEYMF